MQRRRVVYSGCHEGSGDVTQSRRAFGLSPRNDIFGRAMPEQTAILTALILDRPLCGSCISAKTRLTSDLAVETLLHRIRRVLTVNRNQGRCSSCGRTATVISADRPQ
jgi:hypothetical protein